MKRIALVAALAVVVMSIAYIQARAQIGPLGGAILNLDQPAGGGGCTNSFNFAQACNSMYGGGKVLF